MTENREMPFLDHLEELRRRLIVCAASVGIGSVIGFWAVWRFDLPRILLAPLTNVVNDLRAEGVEFQSLSAGTDLYFMSLSEPFFFLIKMAILAGLILASPIIVHQVWAFLSPALTERERKTIIPTMTLGVVLFGIGVSFCYFLVLEPAIRFFLVFGAQWFTPALNAEFYLAFVSRMLLTFGIAFELPVVMMMLTAMGVVTPRLLRQKRRHAIVAVTVFAAILSPGDMVHVTLMLMGPMILLYEFGIVCSAIVARRRKQEQDLRPLPPEDSVSFHGMVLLAALAGRTGRR